MKSTNLAIIILCAATLASAQTQSAAPNTTASATPSASTVTRTTQAVHYRLQGGTPKVDFQGTRLLPSLQKAVLPTFPEIYKQPLPASPKPITL
ncbi:MAG: hypothetical protein WB660_14405 [Candidatus Sulfotelmatobacter sp.]